MHQSLAKFSESEASNHTPSLADFTTTTPELKFSVHTATQRRQFVSRTEKQFLLNDCRGPFVENAGPHDHSGSNLETNREFNGPGVGSVATFR
jgi:hypothetical protein